MGNGLGVQFPAFGNVLCPPWMAFSRVLAGIRDVESDLDLPPVTITGAASGSNFSLGNNLPIDADGDFLGRDFQFIVLPGSTATPDTIRARLRDGDGRQITTDFVPILDLNGPWPLPLPMRRGSVLIVDFQSTDTNPAHSATIHFIIRNWKRNTCDDKTALSPPYVPMSKRVSVPLGRDFEDYEYPFTFTAAAAGDFLRVPLQTDNDADFLWRGITGDWNTANNDVAAVGSAALRFYDPLGVPLSQTGLSNPWSSPNVGQFRELILPSGGGRPYPVFHEIWIPRGGVVLADISFGAAATVRFSLRGLKLYGGACR